MKKYYVKMASLFVVIFFLFPWNAAAASGERRPYFETLNSEAGLSQVVVVAIAQDYEGFIWFATQDGLNKYDGYEFKIYRHEPDIRESLPDSYITSLCVDGRGVLWVGCQNGSVVCYDREHDAFRGRLPETLKLALQNSSPIQAIYQDRSGVLWIGTATGGLFRLNTDGSFSRFTGQPGKQSSLTGNNIRTIYEDSDGVLWVGAYDGGLSRMNRETGTFFSFLHQPDNSDSLCDNRVTCICESRNGELWIGTGGGGVSRFNRRGETFSSYGKNAPADRRLNDNEINFIYEDQGTGYLWIAGNTSGLDIISPSDPNVQPIYISGKDSSAGNLPSSRIYAIFKDKTGLMWLGTYRGVAKYNPERLKFDHINPLAAPGATSMDQTVRAIFEDRRGDVWIGSFGGLHRYNRKNQTTTTYRNNPKKPDSLPDNRILGVMEDRENRLWVSTLDGLCLLNRETGRFRIFRRDPGDPFSIGGNRVRCVLEDRQGNFWVATIDNGLNLLDRGAYRFTHFRCDPLAPGSISHNNIVSLTEGQASELWIGTYGGGINKFDIKTGRFVRYFHNPDDSNSLSSNRALCIHEDRRGSIWVGLDGGGLNRFTPSSRQWKRFSTRDGLPNNVIYGILEDNKGYLWLSSNHGVIRLNPETLHFSNYTPRDGLINTEFNGGAYFKNPISGEMFFGGINGIDSFFPDAIAPIRRISPVVVTAFRQFDRILAVPRGIMESKEVTLDYGNNFFSVDFTAPEFRNPDKINYSCFLAGHDPGWSLLGNRRYASYIGLSPGHYTFYVRAANQDGALSDTSVQIRILPPVWRTWQFTAVLFIFLALLILMFNYFRSRSLLERSRRLELINSELNRQVQERLQAERLQAALFRIARIVHSDMSFDDIYRAIHLAIGDLLDASNFYIGLYEPVDDSIFLPYFVDEFDKLMGRRIKATGLTGYLIRHGKPLLMDELAVEELKNLGELELMGAPFKIWLGVPLKYKSEVFGAIVVQHYRDPNAYTEKEKDLLEFVSHQIAGIIARKREEEEKKTLKEKLVMAEKMEAIGRLAGGVAHDLNNVLSAIVSYPELMLMKLPDDSPFRKPLLTMKRSGQRAAAIVQDLLTLARRGVDVREVVNWNDIIEDYMKSPVFDRLKTQHPLVAWELNLEKDLMNIEGSSVHLTKALMNLCSNAAEAMPDGGGVSIATSNLYPEKTMDEFGVQNYIVVTVSDSGVGIGKKDLKRIFEPFYTKKEMGVSGTGLGMTIVWNTVQDHDGYINVWSERGKGATFELYFPVTAKTVLQKQTAPQINEFMGDGRRILVVDDILEQREIVTVLLNELGYKVDAVSSGEEAVEYLRRHDADLVLLDMIMTSGMDGLDTFLEIQKLKPEIRTVIASGYSETGRVRKALQLGAGAYVQKPYTLEKIGLAIKKELEKNTKTILNQNDGQNQ